MTVDRAPGLSVRHPSCARMGHLPSSALAAEIAKQRQPLGQEALVLGNPLKFLAGLDVGLQQDLVLVGTQDFEGQFEPLAVEW